MSTEHPWQVNLRREVRDLEPELVRLRRDFHRHPEPGFAEERTAAQVVEWLEACGGFRIRKGVAQTGVVADLMPAEKGGPVVLLRADMDALRIQEANQGLEYRSQRDGVMHACGHDAHMAILLGVARVLSEQRSRMKGGVRLVFQPAEEGPGGAEPMIAAGVLEDPRPVAAFAMHVWSLLPAGQVALQAGPIMASTDEIYLRVAGRAGHGACPHETVDPILAASQLVVALQSLVSRNVDPLDSAVITIGKMSGGSVMNAIAAEVALDGTLRTYLPETRVLMMKRIREVAEGIDRAHGTRTKVTIVERYPALVNDAEVTRLAQGVVRQVVGSAQITGMRLMGGEDMAFILQQVPGCFLFLGAGHAQNSCDYPHHHPEFNLDEGVLPLGVELFLRLAEHFTDRQIRTI